MSEQETVQTNEATAPDGEVKDAAEQGSGADDAIQAQLPDEESGGEEKLVPVSEARRYRKRAQAAEKIASDLQQELAAKEADLAQRRRDLEELQLRQEIDELLIEAEVVDLETGRLLTELAAAATDEPDVEQAVAELQRRKPFLFRRSPRSSGALSPRAEGDDPLQHRLEDAAAEAGITGRRQDLLRYLRLRRKK
ncbi:MAG: hypothetical protein JSV91_13035 [Phycisphaerales bacterium]|nr:MAG: hypothetical protein JSV91_13035 [Phycisphaerales bacterium]